MSGEVSLGEAGLGRPLDLRGFPLQDLGGTLRQVLEGGGRRIVLDISQVRFIGSAGLGELVQCSKRAAEKGGDIRLLSPTPKVRELFEMTGLSRVFLIYEKELEAVASFEQS